MARRRLVRAGRRCDGCMVQHLSRSWCFMFVEIKEKVVVMCRRFGCMWCG